MSETIPRIKEFPKDSRTWRVDWFGAVERNYNVPTEPTVEVIISPLEQGNFELASVSAVNDEERRIIRIGIGQLPFITIGSLWIDGYCQLKKAGNIEHLTNLTINSSSVQMVASGYKENDGLLIPYKYYRLGGAGLRANCLAISNNNDPFNIIIPIAEILRFYYATSTDMAHSLFDGAFKHNLNSIINEEESDFDDEHNTCIIKLRQRFSDDDAWIIGRILHSHEAQHGAHQVHDSTMRESLNRSDRWYPETSFPFAGKSSLRVRAKKIQSTSGQWRYLVFEIEHCTGSFPFEHLFCDRDNSNLKADPETDIPDEEKKDAFKKRKKEYDPNEHEAQSEKEPSRYNPTIKISNPSNRFGAIAGKYLEKPETRETNPYKSTHEHQPTPSGELGTGKGEYSESGVSPLKANTEVIRAKALSARLKNFAKAIELLNEINGVTASIRLPNSQTEFVPLTRPRKRRQWSYLDSKSKCRRHVLIADVVIDTYHFSLIEFEWRKSEHFKLAILCSSSDKAISDSSIHKLLQAMAIKKGRWESIPASLTNIKIDTMKHTWSSIGVCAASIQERIIK